MKCECIHPSQHMNVTIMKCLKCYLHKTFNLITSIILHCIVVVFNLLLALLFFFYRPQTLKLSVVVEPIVLKEILASNDETFLKTQSVLRSWTEGTG